MSTDQPGRSDRPDDLDRLRELIARELERVRKKPGIRVRGGYREKTDVPVSEEYL